MTPLSSALREFAETFGREIDRGSVEFVAGRKVPSLPEAFPSNAAIVTFYSELSFSSHIDVGGEMLCTLYALEKLSRAQEGYRYVTDRNGRPQIVADWPPAWLVIGDRNGDAIMADTSAENTPIYGYVHGAPISKSSRLMAPSLALWLQALTRSMQCELNGFDLDTKDETWAPKAEFLAQAGEIAREVLGDEAAAGWMHFFFG